MTFEDFKLNRQLLNAVEDMGWTKTTEIQQKAIPIVLAGHDLVGVAQTGTGKTAAYTLPLLRKLNYAQIDQPRALILAPTKELIVQVKSQIEELSKYTDLRCVALYGGIGAKAQIAEIQKGCDIIVATPGRFMDIYLKGELVTKHIKTMVMDEADRLMDMGFMPQIRKILEVVPNKRQNLLFSATFPQKVEVLADEFVEYAERVEVTRQSTTAITITQSVYHCDNFMAKLNLLLELLKDESMTKVMVFVNAKDIANNIHRYLDRKIEGGVQVIHSNKGQNARINAMKSFEDGELRVLVATDVSARGIDINNISHVINFEVPFIYEEYVHRIGRTGRAFKEGIAISFANKAEELQLKKIEEVINETIPVIKFPENVSNPPTPKEEMIAIARKLDDFKKREDPTFKGAFHDRKKKSEKKKKKK